MKVYIMCKCTGPKSKPNWGGWSFFFIQSRGHCIDVMVVDLMQSYKKENLANLGKVRTNPFPSPLSSSPLLICSHKMVALFLCLTSSSPQRKGWGIENKKGRKEGRGRKGKERKHFANEDKRVSTITTTTTTTTSTLCSIGFLLNSSHKMGSYKYQPQTLGHQKNGFLQTLSHKLPFYKLQPQALFG